MTTELDKLRTSLILDCFEWTIRYSYKSGDTEGSISLLVKENIKGGLVNVGCPSESDVVNILKQASPNISAEPVGTLMCIYGYRLFWAGDAIQSLEYDLSEGKFKSVVLAPKAISNFEY